MATDKKELSVYKDGAKRPYFVKAENVNLGTKENPEFLDDKLGDIEEDIEDIQDQLDGAGSGSVNAVKVGETTYTPNEEGVVDLGEGGYTPPQGGIPKTDLAPAVQTSLDKADSAYQKPASGIPATDIADGVIPDVSGFATKVELDGYVEKETGYGLSKNDFTDADKVAVALIPSKANDNVVVKSISVNGGTPQTPTEGNVNISVEGTAGDDGITPHIGANGNWWVGPETDSNNDTGVHAQGPAGTSFTDADLEIANVLDGTGDVLGVGGAMMIKNNMNVLAASLNRLYNKLANMAFWDAADQAAAAPTPIDWSIPKHQLTVTNNNANAKVYRNGAEVTGSLNIEENATVELVVAPVGDYVVSGVTPSTGTATDLGDGTFKVVLTMGNSDIALTLTVTTTATYAITVNGTHVIASGDTRIVAGGTATVNLAAENGFELPDTSSGITISGATITSYTPSQDLTTAVLVIGSANGAVTIGVTAAPGWRDCPIEDVMEGSIVARYAMARGSVNGFNGRVYVTSTESPNTIVSPKHQATADGPSTGAGDTSAYFFPTEGYNKIKVRCILPSSLASDYYIGINLVNYGSTYNWLSRDTYIQLTDGATECDFTINSSASFVKIIFALSKTSNNQTASAAETDVLLRNLAYATFQYKLYND